MIVNYTHSLYYIRLEEVCTLCVYNKKFMKNMLSESEQFFYLKLFYESVIYLNRWCWLFLGNRVQRWSRVSWKSAKTRTVQLNKVAACEHLCYGPVIKLLTKLGFSGEKAELYIVIGFCCVHLTNPEAILPPFPERDYFQNNGPNFYYPSRMLKGRVCYLNLNFNLLIVFRI